MFDNFSIQKYKSLKHPPSSSLKTLSEIKFLNSKQINSGFAQKYDNIERVFKDLFNNKSRKYLSELVANLIKESSKPILKIKNYHNRERPNVVAEKYGINLPYVKMSSAQTPSFPSGHSAQAFLIKEVLTDMYPEMNPLFVKAADNISKSRIIANVHYNSDKVVGERLGIDLYNHLKNI